MLSWVTHNLGTTQTAALLFYVFVFAATFHGFSAETAELCICDRELK